MGIDMNMSIKKKKEMLDSKLKELRREQVKLNSLKGVLDLEQSGYTGRNSVENSLVKSVSLIKSIRSEMEEIERDLYGSWAPPSKEEGAD
jgi:hypothetical protein